MKKNSQRFKHSGKGLAYSTFDKIKDGFNEPLTLSEIIAAINALVASDEFDSDDRSELAAFFQRNVPMIHAGMFLEMIQATWQKKKHTQAEFEDLVSQCVFIGMEIERRRLRELEPLLVIGGNSRENAKRATKMVEKPIPPKKELLAVFKDVRNTVSKETLVAIEVGRRFKVKQTTLYKWKKHYGIK